jgi:membrane protein DedA with SNARE-associated domain
MASRQYRGKILSAAMITARPPIHSAVFFLNGFTCGGMTLFSHIEEQIVNALQSIFDQFGWVGVAGLMAFENATGITPSEIILGLAGWLLLARHDAPFTAVFPAGLVAALGSVIGASFTYWLARLGGRPAVERILGWIGIRGQHIVHGERQFQRWGPGLVFFGRMVPGVRTLITIPAGLARMPFWQFLLATFSGAYLWCTLLLGVGYFLGHEWAQISDWVSRFAWVVIIVVGLASAGWIGWKRAAIRRWVSNVRQSIDESRA